MAKRKLSGHAWITQVFKAAQANQGNIVRRSIRSVMQYCGAPALEAEVRSRGFHMAVIGDQYVIVCNTGGQISVVC